MPIVPQCQPVPGTKSTAVDFSPTPTCGPEAPFPQISQDLAQCLEMIQIWISLYHPTH